MSGKLSILMTDELTLSPALARAGIGALPCSVLSRGERVGRRLIEFFIANIRNRNAGLAYARPVKQFFDWSEERGLGLVDIEPGRCLYRAARCRDGETYGQATLGGCSATVRLPGHGRDSTVESGGFGSRSQVRGEARQDAGPFFFRRGASTLLDSINTSELIGLRDRALIGLQLRAGERRREHAG
jgi:hypothetical protein